MEMRLEFLKSSRIFDSIVLLNGGRFLVTFNTSIYKIMPQRIKSTPLNSVVDSK